MPYADPEKYKAYQREYYATHREKDRAYRKVYSLKNKEKFRAYRIKRQEQTREHNAKWRKENPGYAAAWREKNRKWHREYKAEYARKQRKEDLHFRVQANLSRRVRLALSGGIKSARTLELLGCEIEFLRGYLENQFKLGMTWDNYNHAGWHIDHIRPCANFDLTDPNQQRQCFHFSNLQPLWAKDNLSKGAKYGP